MLDRTAAKWDAVQPQFGGQFNVTTSFFKAHGDIIKIMTVAKYNTALLIPHVGREITVVIQDGAIDAAIQDIDLTKTMLKHQEDINKSDNSLKCCQVGTNTVWWLIQYVIISTFLSVDACH